MTTVVWQPSGCGHSRVTLSLSLPLSLSLSLSLSLNCIFPDTTQLQWCPRTNKWVRNKTHIQRMSTLPEVTFFSTCDLLTPSHPSPLQEFRISGRRFSLQIKARFKCDGDKVPLFKWSDVQKLLSAPAQHFDELHGP